MSQNNEFGQEIKGHEYDGIREYDNPLPTWWLITFYGTIIFAAIYWFHYHVSDGPSIATELATDLKEIEAMKAKSAPAGDPAEGVDLAALVKDLGTLESGKTVYTQRCAPCHGALGQGQIGPNLTDSFWIHGNGSVGDVLNVVAKGVTEKGMPAWESMVSPKELQAVSAYVVSLRGSNPPNGKAAEGQEIKE